ncbi:c-type cytochrome [Rhodopila sp.]|uniref:c-type cytochrome n=1 Tax=Rhodopila sp. TaxID=2480087 RepID=UPI003D138C39
MPVRACGIAMLAMLLLVTGCKRENMYTQGKLQTWDRNNFFANNATMQLPPAGSIARATPNQPVPQPAVADAAMLARGRERYNIFCTPCHGLAGDAAGMIVQRGFPQPPSFHSIELQQAKASRFYDAITNGHGVMYSYADRVPPADRWAVIAYIRALQRSQDAPATVLSAQDRGELGGSP